jgi:hypothetical protein
LDSLSIGSPPKEKSLPGVKELKFKALFLSFNLIKR